MTANACSGRLGGKWGRAVRAAGPVPDHLIEAGIEMADRTPHFKKKAIPQASRRAVAIAAGAMPGFKTPLWCELCGAKGYAFWPCRYSDGLPGAWVAFDNLEIDHIERECFGGSMDPSNLRLLCPPCNRRRPRLH